MRNFQTPTERLYPALPTVRKEDKKASSQCGRMECANKIRPPRGVPLKLEDSKIAICSLRWTYSPYRSIVVGRHLISTRVFYRQLRIAAVQRQVFKTYIHATDYWSTFKYIHINVQREDLI